MQQTHHIEPSALRRALHYRKMVPSDVSDIADAVSDDQIVLSQTEMDSLCERLKLSPTRIASGEVEGRVDDLQSGAIVSHRSENYSRVAKRDGRDYYRYTHLANTQTCPGIMALEIDVLCDASNEISPNLGHDSWEFVYVVEGKVKFDWRRSAEASMSSSVLSVGDSAYLEPWLVHSFVGIDGPAKIVAINFSEDPNFVGK